MDYFTNRKREKKVIRNRGRQTGKNYGNEETDREMDDSQDRQDRDTEIFRQKQT